MIVKNTLPGPIFVGIPVARLLLSGNNEIPTKEYAELRPHIGDHIENGALVEVSGEVPVIVPKEGDAAPIGDVSKIKEYKSLSPETKKGLIKDTVDLGTLDAWLATESDSSIRLLIERKIIEVKEYKGPEGEK